MSLLPIHIVECPRDAMQGWPTIIPTDQKVNYINQLLQVGFHSLDCLSFVSAKAIPQMADSHEVVKKLIPGHNNTRILAIVANLRGATEACDYDIIQDLGFPFSLSPTFQLRNANSTMEESWERVMDIQNLCSQKGKALVVYLSMGFGNAYGDLYNEDLVIQWTGKLASAGIRTISLADTVGVATAQAVYSTTKAAVDAFPDLTIGLHLHSTEANWLEKMDAGLKAGSTRFDGAIKGFGGCPMAGNDLVGNMDTLLMTSWLTALGKVQGIDQQALARAAQMASDIFV